MQARLRHIPCGYCPDIFRLHVKSGTQERPSGVALLHMMESSTKTPGLHKISSQAHPMACDVAEASRMQAQPSSRRSQTVATEP